MSGSNGTKPKSAKKRKFRTGKLLAWCGAAAAIALVCVTIGYVAIIINGKQFIVKYQDKMVMAEASTMYDINDKEVGVLLYHGENRELVEYKDIPTKLANAFIATEDRRFDKHAGVDFWAVGRALVKDVVNRSAVEGGSTITQQLAKNMFLTYDKTFFRKATEASIALALENEFTKDKILTMYLNRIYFGKGAYGIKVAAKQYFGITNLNDLKIWQMATLAGIPKSPGNYNPLDNPDKSKERRGVVLKLMYDQGYITEQEKNEAMDIEYSPPQQAGSKEDYQTFRDYVIKEAQETYGIEEDQLLRGGYKIMTTMDANAQKLMEQAFENKNLFPKDGPEQKSQGSMVIVNNKDGGIVAMIGGRDYVDKGLNRAVVPRQPGSSFKPVVVYAPAIESGKYYPSSMLKDEEKDYKGYSPRNYDGVYRGEVDMYEAVRKSINAPAVWLLNEITLSKGMQFAERMGIPFDKRDTNLAIALGGMTKGVTPLQMAQAYSAFANGGYLNKAHAIRDIIDTNGVKANTSFKPSKTKVMNPKTSYYITQLLQGVVDSGTGTAAKMNRPAAGKTGTTQLDLKGLEKFNRDIWFVGYTPEWSAAVWMGFDKTDSKHYISSGTALPAAMFKEVMSKALAKVPVTSFPKPEGVDEVKETPKPAGTALLADYVKETRKVRLAWTKDDSNSGGTVQVFRKESKDPEFAKILEVNGGTEANDISIQPGKTYQYYIVPFHAQSGTAGEKSNIVEVAVPQDASASPLPSLSPTPGPGDASGKPGDNGKGGKSPKPTPVPGQSGLSPSPKPTPDTSVQPSASTNPGAATQADPAAGADPTKVSIDLPAGSKNKEPAN